MADRLLLFGYPEEAEQFRNRHPLWMERFPNLTKAIDIAFTRNQNLVLSDPADKFVHLFGRMCVEDFMEILLVCGNAYGYGAMKLLRSMYEHTVTLGYIHNHPKNVAQFMDYHWVQQFKLMQHIRQHFGDQVFAEGDISTSDLQSRYCAVKDSFRVPHCKKCGTTRINHSWTTLDFASLAKQAGDIGTLIVQGYFIPLRYSHSTLAGLMDRVEIAKEGMEFQPELQPQRADDALLTAHNCLLNVLNVQEIRFRVEGLGAQLQTCFQDFLEIWAPKPPLPLSNT